MDEETKAGLLTMALEYGWEISTVLLSMLVVWLRQKGAIYARGLRLVTDSIELSTYDKDGNKCTEVAGIKEVIKQGSLENRKEHKIVAESAKRSQAEALQKAVGSYRRGVNKR